MKKDMSYEKMKTEYARVQRALDKTTSPHLKRDYSKYLSKLKKRMNEFELSMFKRIITK